MDRQALLEAETVVDLTTAARVKALMGMTGTAWDTVLGYMITMLSQDAMINILKRGVKSEARTEYFDVAEDQQSFFCLGSPIDTGSTITVVNNVSNPRDWTVTAVDSDYVICDPERAERGEILIETGLSPGPNALKVTYTGGMGANTAAIISSYPAIAMALDIQTEFIYQNKREFP
jgi:hypothetical protein